MLLTLPQIAAWQIDHSSAQPQPYCMADLPALQRGAVWKAGQIEVLWDSIFQGFPLGAFLLSPFDASLGHQSFMHKKPSAQAMPCTHMLLDGQQRANGIALGFFNPWHDMSVPSVANVKSVLWVDLAPPPKGRDVAYVFRAVTRAHPWGYSLVDPESRITQHQIRQSLHAFKAASASLYDAAKPHEIPLHAVWPWDAVAPVPVSLLVQALHKTQGAVAQAKDLAWQDIQRLALMRTVADGQKDPLPDHTRHWAAQQDAVRRAFNDRDSRLNGMLALLWQRMSEYVIPANIVPIPAIASRTTTDAGQQSPVETLFIRINSAGTPLGGEELMYSLIKSSWKDAPRAIAKLEHKLATPARIALLASRLVLARHQREQQANNPDGGTTRLRLIANPSVDDFRRLMNGQNKEHPVFAQDLKSYVSGDGLKVFEAAHWFLTQGQHGLPPVLANELAQRSPDVFFLFLCWLDRLGVDVVRDLAQKKPHAARRVLGFLTALAWFAKADSKPRAVDAIWHDLQTLNAGNLPDFFSRQRLLKTMAIDTRGRRNMIPVLDPDVLQRALQKRILGYQGCTETISRPGSPIWTDWNRWQWLIDQKDINDALCPVFQEANLTEGETVSDRIRDTWNQFMEALWDNKSMLLYAQRDCINRWFSDFDPSLPEFLEDKNRPWDYDHIHAKSFLQGRNGGTLQGLPKIIKDWHNSIGNLRAWPLEANRSDGDAAPSVKLTTARPEEDKYGITGANKCAASFITSGDFDGYWSRCVPADRKKLNDSETFPERQALVNAMVWRFLAIYRKWYDDLKLSTLT